MQSKKEMNEMQRGCVSSRIQKRERLHLPLLLWLTFFLFFPIFVSPVLIYLPFCYSISSLPLASCCSSASSRLSSSSSSSSSSSCFSSQSSVCTVQNHFVVIRIPPSTPTFTHVGAQLHALSLENMNPGRQGTCHPMLERQSQNQI